MSHFSVLVVGDPEYQLAPFHEFECTGSEDEFVLDIDQTEEKRAEFAEASISRYKAPDGSLHCPYEGRFYRPPTTEETAKIGPIAGSGCGNGMSWSSRDWGDGKGYSTRIHFLPKDWSEVELPAKEVMTFRGWLEWDGVECCTYATLEPEGRHKCGYALLDDAGEVVKVMRRTNPNAKWDWWQVGGRYSKGLLLKDGTRVDTARKGDIDFEGIRRDACSTALNEYLLVHAAIDEHPVPESWESVLAKHSEDVDAARREYNAQPAVVAFRKIPDLGPWGSPAPYLVPRLEYLEAAEKAAFTCFAFVKDRQWAEQGNMGWWAIVRNEKDKDDWQAQVNAFVESLADDEILTFVDCHI